jgi:hypothetical protein
MVRLTQWSRITIIIYVAINLTDLSGFNNADIAASPRQPMTS